MDGSMDAHGNLDAVILSNKQWMRRLRVVMVMEKWVADNLKTQGAYDSRNRNPRVLLDKGKEYFYGYLFWGRRVFSGSTDPLFFDDDGKGNDGSLIDQLQTREKYTEFIEVLRGLRNEMMIGVDADRAVTHTNVGEYVVQPCSDIDRLAVNIPESDTKEHEIIGLILRYRCVGGFESNLHGSVTADWAKSFEGYTECFASPLNHKFIKFHSLFDDDTLFGGQGDFFKMVEKNRGIFPTGSYEINPPFHSALLDQVADIVARSFKSGVTGLKIVMIVPKWGHTNFIPVLDNVCFSLEENGYVLDERYGYNHSSGKPLSANTKFYVLASKDIPVDEFSRSVVLCRKLVSSGPPRFRAVLSQFSTTLDGLIKIQD